MKYEVGVDLLYDLPYADILDIFARLNTYTVKLNSQELLNAKYVGYFKQLVYTLGYRYVDYLIDSGVMTKAQISRMKEAELSSDLIIALIDGVQTNRGIEQFYRKFEEEFDDGENVEKQFDKVMTYVAAIYPGKEMADTNWSRYHLFYTLFTVVAHVLFGVSDVDDAPRPKLTAKNLRNVRTSLDDISAQYHRYTADRINRDEIPPDWREFIERSTRATTNSGSRRGRTKFVSEKLVAAL